MTESPTIQRWREEQGTPTGKATGMAITLVEATDLGIIKLPKPIENALDDIVLAETEWVPALEGRRADTEAALKAAPAEQKAKDGEAVATALRKGPDAFAQLSTLVEENDLVAEAQEAHEKAARTYQAARIAVRGLHGYMGNLAKNEYRKDMLGRLDGAYNTYVKFNTTSQTKLGELHRLEAVAEEAKTLILAMLIWVESPNIEDKKKLRAAFKSLDEWDEMPTLTRIRAKEAEARAPEEAAAKEAEAAKRKKREQDRAYARENALIRRGIGRADATESEADESELASTTN